MKQNNVNKSFVGNLSLFVEKYRFIDQQQWDDKFMTLAVRIAQKNVGITSPNPAVGCVIVKNNTIIATGVTAGGGHPHAEAIAIDKAKGQIKGAVLYVTLEPCSHFGETNPCADLIIKSGISRVVAAVADPDKRVNGSGIKKLRQAGIEVKVGILEKEAREVNVGFFTAQKLKRPFITLKLATSLDGKIATGNFDSKWITNEKSRQYAHYLRAKNDAILIGNNTARQDNPMLNCRIAGLEYYSPRRIIISNKPDINLNSKIIQTAKDIPTYIAVTHGNKNDYQKFLNYGVKIITCKQDQSNLLVNHCQLDLKDLVNKLYKLGINNLLIEGGQIVATAFLKQNLIDQLIWIKSNKVIGNDGIAAIGNLQLESMVKINDLNLKFDKINIKEFGDDIVIIYKNYFGI